MGAPGRRASNAPVISSSRIRFVLKDRSLILADLDHKLVVDLKNQPSFGQFISKPGNDTDQRLDGYLGGGTLNWEVQRQVTGVGTSSFPGEPILWPVYIKIARARRAIEPDLCFASNCTISDTSHV